MTAAIPAEPKATIDHFLEGRRPVPFVMDAGIVTRLSVSPRAENYDDYWVPKWYFRAGRERMPPGLTAGGEKNFAFGLMGVSCEFE